MINFFRFSWPALVFITFILGICVLSQTIALLLNYYRNKLKASLVSRNLLEVLVLSQILILALMHGQIINGYKRGFVISIGYEGIRIFTFIMILITALIISVLNKTFLPIAVVPATTISLPIIGNILGDFFPWFFIGVLIFFLGRSIKICISSIIGIRTSISSLSIIHAIDTLNTGVLFSERNGYILLSNNQMQNLMYDIAGKIFRNSIEFYEKLITNQHESGYRKTELDGQVVYLSPDGAAWMFTKTDIQLGMKNYIHISAADVTELWILTSKLQVKDRELRYKSNELKETMANLNILSKKKEIENAKMRAHDLLGQRLSLLLRIMQNEGDLDYNLLTSLSKGLLAELKVEQNETRPGDELKSIQQTFATIGVDIKFDGQFPDNKQQASLFIDIIREGTTNAVRHALATEINIKVEPIEDTYNLTINNNGHIPSTPIIPGSGIKVMEKKVQDQGENLNIIYGSLFTLSVVLPGGVKNE